MKEKEIATFLSNRSSKNFAALFAVYSQPLMRMAMYIVKRQTQYAEDLVQETWITAIEKLDTFSGKSTFKTWITGILINKYREHARKHNYESLELVNVMNSADLRPDLSIDLQNALLQLPDGYREILVLHDIEGFKHKEIAEILNISDGTSKSQLFQARKSMRTQLKGYKLK